MQRRQSILVLSRVDRRDDQLPGKKIWPMTAPQAPNATALQAARPASSRVPMTQEANQVTSYISALNDAADRIEQASQLVGLFDYISFKCGRV